MLRQHRPANAPPMMCPHCGKDFHNIKKKSERVIGGHKGVFREAFVTYEVECDCGKGKGEVIKRETIEIPSDETDPPMRRGLPATQP